MPEGTMRFSVRSWVALVAGLSLGTAAVGCGGGTDGTSSTVTDNPDGSATITCDDGTSATVSDGMNGMDGTTCTVTDDGAGTKTISCSDGTMVTVTDGTDGMDGTDGTNAAITGPGLILEVTAAGIDTDRHPYAELLL